MNIKKPKIDVNNVIDDLIMFYEFQRKDLSDEFNDKIKKIKEERIKERELELKK